MIRRKLAALFAALMIGTMMMPVTYAYAQVTDPDVDTDTVVETVTVEGAEEEIEPAEPEETPESFSEEDALSEVAELITGNPDFFSEIIGDLDPETLAVLMENPKLLGYFLPTLHVTVTDGAVTIAYKEIETEDQVLTGTVTTMGSNLNVRTGPSTGYDIISSLANGSQVEILDEEDGWYRISFPADLAYVCGQYVRLNDITPTETPEGYSFDITGEELAELLSTFCGYSGQEPQVIPEAQGLTPDGNLTLVDDFGEITGEGQQFITLVTKAGNYFYLIIDRDEKGEETVHFLNMVDERDLFSLIDEEEAAAMKEELAAEEAARQAAENPPTVTPSETEPEVQEPEQGKKGGGILPALIILLLVLGGGGAFFFIQLKNKKKEEAERPDPDADYDEEDDLDFGYAEDASSSIEDEEFDTGEDEESM